MKILPLINKVDALYSEKISLKKEKLRLEELTIKSKKDIIKHEIMSKIVNSCHGYFSQIDYYSNLEKLNHIYDKIKLVEKSISNLCRFYISWSLITFHDQYIEIVFEDYKSQKIGCSKSRETFNLIKLNILKKMSPIMVIWSRSKRMFIVPNKISFSNVILYLSIRNELEFEESPSFISVMESSNLIKEQRLFFSSFFDKSLYLEYWSNKQSLRYKIIPALEKHWNGNVYECEDVFLFTIELDDLIIIVWENVNNERATFLFKTSSIKYVEDIQVLFDYISSNNKRKRKSLYHKSDKNNLPLSTIVVYHTDYEKWTNNIEKILGQ